jgi:hypothetical protein
MIVIIGIINLALFILMLATAIRVYTTCGMIQTELRFQRENRATSPTSSSWHAGSLKADATVVKTSPAETRRDPNERSANDLNELKAKIDKHSPKEFDVEAWNRNFGPKPLTPEEPLK